MRFSVIPIIFLLVACDSREQERPDHEGPVRIQNTPWVSYEEPGRFRLRHPKGWRVRFDSRTGKIVVQGPVRESLLIWPLYLPQPLSQPGAARVLQRLATLVGSSQTWESPQALAPTMLRMEGRDGSQIVLASLRWTSTARGTASFYYQASAPGHRYRQAEDIFVEILESFRIIRSQPSDRSVVSRPALQYVRWTEPNEYAFDIEVPRGWHTQGGMVRFSPLDVRTVVQITSPDDALYIFFGDASIPSFILPNEMLAMTGYTEGTWYAPSSVLVKRYVPGVHFAREYVVSTLGRQFAGLTITGSRDRSDAAQAFNAIYQRYGSPYVFQRMDMGEVEFRANRGQLRLVGYTFAGTSLTQSPYLGFNGGLWRVESLFGFVAPAERKQEASSVLAHIIASLRINPQWFQMQQGITHNVSVITAETSRYLSNLISQNFQLAQQRQSEAVRRFSNYLRGVVDVRDPQTQQTYQVQSGANYYWIDALENIVGTQLYENPDVLRFREMVQLP